MADRLISVVVCSRNGAARLGRTLEALAALDCPPGADLEVVAVDNGSTDDTSAVIRSAAGRSSRVRPLQVAREGKAHALNVALAESKGEALLFTDDDVLAPADWGTRMAAPLLSGRCDAVTGRVILAKGSDRSWMTLSHLWWLAAPPDNPDREMVGANMGFHRRVLEKVPRFDAELGPGALGFGEDKLFGLQLQEAGFRTEYLPDAQVVHEIDVGRLTREHWLADAARRGRVDAYHAYHWEHIDPPAPRLRALWFEVKLKLRRLAGRSVAPGREGCEIWEMVYVREIARCRQFARERERPRNYERRGLARRSPD